MVLERQEGGGEEGEEGEVEGSSVAPIAAVPLESMRKGSIKHPKAIVLHRDLCHFDIIYIFDQFLSLYAVRR